MANERKTEIIFKDYLRELGYYDNNKIKIEEQISDNPRIKKLLKNASKKGGGRGYPEFIIQHKDFPDLIIVVECKAENKYHSSDDLDKFSDYAVDGALLYASYLSKEYDVVAIGASGQSIEDYKISHYFILKGDNTQHKYFDDQVLSFENYYQGVANSNIKFNQDYDKLLSYTKSLNDKLHKKKIKENLRSLLISGILIALKSKVFKQSYKLHKTAKQLTKHLLETIINEFANSDIAETKASTLKNSFSFLISHTSLNKELDFAIDLIEDIDENINGFMRTYKYFDTLGQFYIEFLRYANNDKGLGIVLTPPHITDLFCGMLEIDKDSIVLDNCCGTGGFLISAMKMMLDNSKGDGNKIKEIKESQLIGIEYQDDIYTLCITNMIIQGDGKTNIVLGDCFSKTQYIKNNYRPNIGLLNPPYASKAGDIPEREFIKNNLNCLEKGGKCIAIIPMSCVIAKSGEDYEYKKQIMEKHTVEAVVSMPEQLFHNSKASVVTCAVVISAHIPHKKGKKTWLGYRRDDGHEVLVKRGRLDVKHQWSAIRNERVNNFLNREQIEGYSMMKELTPDNERCIEDYLVVNYDNITEDDFKNYIKQHISYRLINGFLDIQKDKVETPKTQQSLVPLSEIFEIRNGLASSNVTVKLEAESTLDIRYIRPSKTYKGSIAGYVDTRFIDDKYIYSSNTTYVSTDGQGSHTYSYVSAFDFVPNSNVSVLVPKRKMSLQEKLFYSFCISLNRPKFSYGRKPKGERLETILIPNVMPHHFSNDYFEEIFNEWAVCFNK